MSHNDSDTDSNVKNGENLSSTNSKKRGRGVKYDQNEEYHSKEDAENQIAVEGIWRKKDKLRKSKAGNKQTYFCKLVPKRSTEQCDAKLFLLCPHEGSSVYIYRTSRPHTHVKITNRLTEQHKQDIIELRELGIKKPNAIITALETKGGRKTAPTKNLVINLLAGLRRIATTNMCLK